MIGNILVGLVALIHVYIVYLEMVLWDTPRGHKTFRLTPEFASASKVLAANQGLYNGFLAAGLIWGALPRRRRVPGQGLLPVVRGHCRSLWRGNGRPQDPLHPDRAGGGRPDRGLARSVGRMGW